MTISVVVADDQPLARAGLRMIIDPQDGIEVIGEAPDGAQAVSLIRRLSPTVAILDIRMPGMDGIEATRRIVTTPGLRTRVLILTTFNLDEYVFEALRVGASGFLLKDVPPEELVQAILTVARGDATLSPAITRRLIDSYVRRPSPSRVPQLAELTGRERDVLVLLGKGLSNAELGEELSLREATVKTHVGRVLAKLDVRDRVQAVIFAYESGLMETGHRPSTGPPID